MYKNLYISSESYLPNRRVAYILARMELLRKRKYCCRRCRAHGLEVSRSNHEHLCPFKNCLCQCCELFSQSKPQKLYSGTNIQIGSWKLKKRYQIIFYVIQQMKKSLIFKSPSDNQFLKYFEKVLYYIRYSPSSAHYLYKI